jgi:hypothetical protein
LRGGFNSGVKGLMKAYRLSWSKNTALEKVFGPKGADVEGHRKTLRSHELQ